MRSILALLLTLLTAAGPVTAAEPARPGEVFRLGPAELPAPNATPSVANPPRTVPRPAEARPQVPPGFTATLFAQGFGKARFLTTAPGGDVFLSDSAADTVWLLRDGDGDGRAEVVTRYAEGFNHPSGPAVAGEALWVADLDRVWRLPLVPGATRADRREAVTPPGALGDGGGHATRMLALHPGGGRFYVAIGSRGNLGIEPEPRATIQEFTLDGRRRSFATGLRNPVGIAFRPGSDELWAVVNERDGLGDGLVPDYFTRVVEGGFYGWPYSYIGSHPQPGFAERAPERVKAALVPDLLFQSHSAPLGLVFYDGGMFPAAWRGDAFVALHGSWNAAAPRGYMVARVPFRDGKPAGHYEAFATGFWTRGDSRAQVWGRPAGLAVARDGSLLIADDVANVVWRVSYAGGG